MQSMTGFAAASANIGARRWRWEGRSVNGRGLDLRLRLPDGFEGMEPVLRAAASRLFARGNLTFALRMEGDAGGASLALNRAGLDAALDAAAAATDAATERGLAVAPLDIAALLSSNGVLLPRAAARPDEDEALSTAIMESFEAVIADLHSARANEGARIKTTFVRLVDEISGLIAVATKTEAEEAPARKAGLSARVNALMASGAEISPDRLAEELALIAVKADVAEEIDRLISHVIAARDLIAGKGAIGRKLDFLTQEFNREANTLCAKSASAALTETGLALKIAIDRLREQAQNVE